MTDVDNFEHRRRRGDADDRTRDRKRPGISCVFASSFEDRIFAKNLFNPEEMEEDWRFSLCAIHRQNYFDPRARSQTLYGSTSPQPPSRFSRRIFRRMVAGHDLISTSEAGIGVAPPPSHACRAAGGEPPCAGCRIHFTP